jgi:hypothetical protein
MATGYILVYVELKYRIHAIGPLPQQHQCGGPSGYNTDALMGCSANGYGVDTGCPVLGFRS